jgi:penicillin-binding protein 1B
MYSSPLDLTALVSRLDRSPEQRAAVIRTVLAERRYSEVARQPSRPGEYSLTSGTLIVFTREFRAPSGELLKSQKFTLGLELSHEDANSRTSVILEPQIISYIGAGEVRASTFTPLAELPLHVQRAVLATEDERFFSHGGIDLIGIARAVVRNVLAGGLVQGGSTITQQLAKNLFLSPKKTFTRKFLEIPTALSLERHLSKQQLLELYLNEVYLGQEGAVAIHGLPQAAGAFFGKEISHVTLDEAAVLAGIIKAPSHFNPRKHPERALERRNIVLSKMADLGMITDTELVNAQKRQLKTASQLEYRRVAPFFTSALEGELSEPLDLDHAQGSGLAIHTGLDLSLQRCAEQAVDAGLARLEKSHPKLTSTEKRLEAALVSLHPQSGLVRSWVGGRNFAASQFNRVNQSSRQIGSTIKPFLYLAALDGSLNSYKAASPSSIVEDKPIEVSIKRQGVWSPENYDHDYRGDVTLRYALENSLNMPALYISERIGLSALRRTVSSVFLAQKVSEVPSLALGALDTNLLRLTAAYGALANGGSYVAPRLFVTALDGQGERLATSDIRENRVADEPATFVLTSILQGVIDRGTGKGARSSGYAGPAAGKTGTSDNSRDAWFVGYSPSLATGVWVGFDDNSPTGLTGGAAAAPIWGEFMNCATPYLAEDNFQAPPGVVFLDVDRNTGGLYTGDCPESARLREVFVRGTEPTKLCPEHSSSSSEYTPSQEALPPSRPEPRGRRNTFWGSLFGR